MIVAEKTWRLSPDRPEPSLSRRDRYPVLIYRGWLIFLTEKRQNHKPEGRGQPNKPQLADQVPVAGKWTKQGQADQRHGDCHQSIETGRNRNKRVGWLVSLELIFWIPF